MKQAATMTKTVVTESPESPHRIQFVFHHPVVQPLKEPEPLVDTVRSTANDQIKSVINDLEKMIGLDEAKLVMYEIYALLRTNRERAKHQLKTEQQVYHMVFKGSPGTGKTTVARIFGKVLKEMGILSKGHLIEVERADLVGEFIGHTAQKTRDLIKKALGGILFVDEAYSLARGGEKDFGKEAVDCLTKAMEDHKNEFICILAGYTEEMDEFLQINPGLPSRFPIQIHFTDYEVDELMEIAAIMVEEKQYVLTSTAKEKMKQHLIHLLSDPFLESFSNARYIRNMLEKAIRAQAMRLLKSSNPSKEELMSIRAEDLQVSNPFLN
ncbi:AAA family ATPase [Brevibacillus sp. 7WMA2]|uniref:Stage V sporulation protein K n=1 Tax=Brevibacillus laterosporus LMG 15441 TaxID=1042163 RepID=A0A075R802_BRELA|nr:MULTISPECIES: AAA family ATPase [Brevibacillus]AIG27378.1 stage V sporulation protein K [Brevibacillus laterosporus LMG 15441]AUM65751.1 AAA family ATPase [Brevibacillus laterosporus]AYK08749.1 AAA family ATPase [Brevibacillus laterosporus]ERM19648.1 protein SpoVK [Brevibacillus laterosporus PE36]MCR8962568.1 AAA family ATPase [Brevibacillus laterosporus]